MNAITLLFTGTLLASLWVLGLAVKNAVLLVVKPQGTTRRKLSSLAFAVVLLLPSILAAGVSLGVLTPASWGGAVHGLLLTTLSVASCAIQLKLAFITRAKPAANDTENEAAMAAAATRIEPSLPANADVAATLEKTAAPVTAAPATVVASTVAPLTAATVTTCEEFDELDAWANDQASTPAVAPAATPAATPAVTRAVAPTLTLVKSTPAVLPEVLTPASASLVVVDVTASPALDLVDAALRAEALEAKIAQENKDFGQFETQVAMNDARYATSV
jgi:hypothetical protein